MYIIKKLLSTARPDMKRDNEKIGTFVVKTVIPLPISAITFEKISTGRRPIESAIPPNICVPKTEPTKNIDWPIVDFHAESHTQFNCFNRKEKLIFFLNDFNVSKKKKLKRFIYFTAHTRIAMVQFIKPTITICGAIFRTAYWQQTIATSVFGTWWIRIMWINVTYFSNRFICQFISIAPAKKL